MKKKSLWKRLTAAALAVVTAAALWPAGSLPMRAQAAEISHTKATSADVQVRNPEKMKGVQGTEITTGNYPSTIPEMGLDWCLLNVDLATIIAQGTNGTPYNYNGKTYYFNDAAGSMLMVYEARVKEYRKQGVSWCFNIVMSYRSDLTNLYYNAAPGKIYYALNVDNAAAMEQMDATLHYLVEQFGYSDTFVQNWRFGNEVNVSHDYNYTGLTSDLTNQLAHVAAESYKLLEKAVRDESPYASTYVSVTHDWQNDNEGKGAPTKDFLDRFNQIVGRGDNWGIDFHAYPPQMSLPVWSKDCAQYLSHRETTKFICAPNLEVLTNYVKNNFGSNHRIIMTEQSYDSNYGEAEQAAMIAYTYNAAVNNDLVDSVIFTTWQDTNSVYHDFYNMGFLTITGQQKLSYNVFKYMDSADENQRKSNVDAIYFPYFSNWTGRTISKWTDDILYQAAPTTATFSYHSIYYPADQQQAGQVFIGYTTTPGNKETDIEYKWDALETATNQWISVQDWTLDNEWLKWFPERDGTYVMQCTARIAGNPSAVVSDMYSVTVTGTPNTGASTVDSTDTEYPAKGASVSTTEGYTLTRNADNSVTCVDAAGNPVIDKFVSDGTYTYYIMANGTAMENRLSYHPDGVHVIYFDSYGHEVFSNFHSVKQGIGGEAVDDVCFFDVYGYQYVNTVTYDQSGQNLYYANPYGVLERKGWFAFSPDAAYGNSGLRWNFTGSYLGYANSDGSLMRNAYTYDIYGRLLFMQANGEAQ